jgi:hypothetical protein
MAHTRNGEKKATRQCWECLKRRLVCDYSLPGCKKCNKTGKECPGYDEQKPLQWVQPGRVTFRKRRRDEPPTVYTVPDEAPCETVHGANSANNVSSGALLESSESADSSSTTSDDSLLAASLTPEDEVISQEYIDYYMFLSPWMLDNESWWSNIAEDEREHMIRDVAVQQAAVANQVSRALRAGGRRKIEAIVKHGAHHEAARLLQSEPYPLRKLDNLLGLMRAYDLPIYDYLSNETSEVVQSVEYCACTIPVVGSLANCRSQCTRLSAVQDFGRPGAQPGHYPVSLVCTASASTRSSSHPCVLEPVSLLLFASGRGKPSGNG